MKSMITALAAALLLTSCAEVPENIRKEKEELDAKSEYTREADISGGSSASESVIEIEGEDIVIERASLAEIRARLDEESSKRFGNMTFAHVSAGISDAMPSYRVEIGGNESVDFKSLVSGMLGEDRFDYNDSTLFDQVSPEGEPAETVTDNDTGAQMLLPTSGTAG